MRHDTFLGRCGAVALFSWGYLVLHLLAILILMWIIPQGVRLRPDQQPTGVAILGGRPVLWNMYPATSGLNLRSPNGQPVAVNEKQRFSIGAGLAVKAAESVDTPQDWTAIALLNGRDFKDPWYYIQERMGGEIRGYFVRYSSRTRQPVLYLGVNGRSTTVPSPHERFWVLPDRQSVLEDMGYSLSLHAQLGTGVTTRGVTLLTKSGLYFVELKARKVSRLVVSTQLKSIAKLRPAEFAYGTLQQNYTADDPIVLRDYDTVSQIAHGRVELSYLIPESLREIGFTAFPVDPQTIYYATTLDERQNGMNQPRDLLKCDATGRVLQQWSVNQPPQGDPYSTLRRDYLIVAAVFPTPLHIAGSLYFVNPVTGINRSELVRRIWPSFVVVSLCGILSVFGAWKLAPRFGGVPARWGWLVFVFVFGVPGLVGYLMHFRHRQRPILEPAPRLGTEVFA